MKIQILPNTHYNNIPQKSSKNFAFKAQLAIETIKHYNLGIMPNGYIGKVKVLKASGKEAFLNVFKKATIASEIYTLKDNLNNTIGEIEIKQHKYKSYDNNGEIEESSHIFVRELRNYSCPNTPYHIKNLEEYKHIGVRLMQIAQRRSDECNLNGNIELISKNESIDFYKKLGFKRIGLNSNYINPNKMYLPSESKETFSKMYGGL